MFRRKSLLIIAIMLMSTLLGCVTTTGQLRKDSRAMSETCRAEGVPVKTVAFAKCLNEKTEAKMIEINYPYFDLIDLSAAYRVYLAEQYELGRVTESEAGLQWANFKTRFAAEEQRRINDTAYAKSAAMQGNAALMQSWGLLLQQSQPRQATQIQPSNVTCMKQGVFTNCNYR